MSYSKVLGGIFRKKREALKLRQEDVAEKLGITAPSYSRLETGIAEFSFNQMLICADYLNIDWGGVAQEAIREANSINEKI